MPVSTIYNFFGYLSRGGAAYHPLAGVLNARRLWGARVSVSVLFLTRKGLYLSTALAIRSLTSMWWACSSSGDEEDDVCVYCGGDGCEECEDQFELVQCRGITLRGTRCQITSDSAGGFGKFADAAYPLTSGSYYCTFHTQQEWERDECDECPECDGEGCPECCLECDGQGCEECQPTDTEEYAAYYSQLRQQQQQHAPSWYAASFSRQRQAYQTPAAVPAAPSQDEVAIVGYRSRQERRQFNRARTRLRPQRTRKTFALGQGFWPHGRREASGARICL